MNTQLTYIMIELNFHNLCGKQEKRWSRNKKRIPPFWIFSVWELPPIYAFSFYSSNIDICSIWVLFFEFSFACHHLLGTHNTNFEHRRWIGMVFLSFPKSEWNRYNYLFLFFFFLNMNVSSNMWYRNIKSIVLILKC